LVLPLLVAADPEGASLLVPGPTELTEAVAEATTRVERAEALGHAATRLQNALGERLASARPISCTDPTAQALLARLTVFAPAWRDAAQSARAQRDRLDRIVAAPTVVPVIDQAMLARIEETSRRTEDQATAYQEFRAWDERYLSREARRCAVDLAASPGLEVGLPVPPDETGRPVAVVGIGGGLVCPLGVPADGTVVLLADGRGCWAATECDCAPVDQLPAAVLGPLAK